MWVKTVSSPARAYLLRKKMRFTCVAFLHPDRLGGESRIEGMQLCITTPVATVEILHQDVGDNSCFEG